jgi:translation initiation factor IF-2
MGFVLTEALILGGQLNVKDKIFLAGKFGSAKIIFDGQNEKKEQVFPGDLVRLVGCDFSTELGERFLVVNHDEKKKIEKELNTLPKKKFANLPLFSEKKNINLLLSANSQNSLETLKSLVGKITNPETNFTIVYELVGKLNNFAVELAKISRSFVVVFGYKLSLKQSEIFRENKLAFFDSQIIYEISDKLKKIILTQKETKESEKITGVGQIIQIFSYSRLGNIAGCQVLNGKINRNDNIHIFRGEKKIFTGLIHSLQSNKINVKTVMKGQNCGIVIRGFNDFQLKDEFIAFQKQKENVI